MAVCQLTEEITYRMCTFPVDMRKQITGLQGIVTSELGRYPVAGEAFVFMGKNRKTVKIIHREGNGITMYVRKLSRGRFKMPSVDAGNGTCAIDYRAFRLLVLGETSEVDLTVKKHAV